jgi:hypothetical protein
VFLMPVLPLLACYCLSQPINTSQSAAQPLYDSAAMRGRLSSLGMSLVKLAYAMYCDMTLEEYTELFSDEVIELDGYECTYLKLRRTSLLLRFEKKGVVERLGSVFYSPIHGCRSQSSLQQYVRFTGSWTRRRIIATSREGIVVHSLEEPTSIAFEDDVVVLYPGRDWSVSLLYKLDSSVLFSGFSLHMGDRDDTEKFKKVALIPPAYSFLALSKNFSLVWYRSKEGNDRWEFEMWIRHTSPPAFPKAK